MTTMSGLAGRRIACERHRLLRLDALVSVDCQGDGMSRMTDKETRRANSDFSGGVGFTGLLTVLFTVLKLAGAISWSWWWVLSPLWIVCAIVLLIVAIWMLVEALS